MEKILVSPLGSPLSRWLGGPHSFDDEIKKLGEQFRIPLICLDDVTEVLPGKCYDVSIGFNYKRKWKIFEKSKETMNYFGIVFCRSKPEDLQLNRFCSDVYQIGVLAKLGDLNSDVDSSLFSFKSLGRFKILGIHHLAEGKLEGTVKLVTDFEPNRDKLAHLDCTIRNELPKSFKTSLIEELVLPKNPIQLSFEIIRILDLKNEDRNEILGMSSAEERLMKALSLMDSDYYVCNWCLKELIFYQSNVFTARSERTGQILYDGLFVRNVETPVVNRPNQPVSSAVDEDYVDGDFLCDDTSYGSDVVLFHSPNLPATSASDEVDFGDDEVDNQTNCSAIPCEVVSYVSLEEEFPSYSSERYRCSCGQVIGYEFTKESEKFWMIDRQDVKGLRFYWPPPIQPIEFFCSFQ